MGPCGKELVPVISARRAPRVFAVALCLSAVGCNALIYRAGPHARWPAYAVGFANRTSEELTHVHAEWTADGVTYTPSAGILVPGGVKVFNDAADPIPAAATVVWQTPDGKEHRRKVDVAKAIHHIAVWSGTVYFKIKGDGVDVVPLTPKEERELAEAGKEYP
jgi:hypothetical protein